MKALKITYVTANKEIKDAIVPRPMRFNESFETLDKLLNNYGVRGLAVDFEEIEAEFKKI